MAVKQRRYNRLEEPSVPSKWLLSFNRDTLYKVHYKGSSNLMTKGWQEKGKWKWNLIKWLRRTQHHLEIVINLDTQGSSLILGLFCSQTENWDMETKRSLVKIKLHFCICSTTLTPAWKNTNLLTFFLVSVSSKNEPVTPSQLLIYVLFYIGLLQNYNFHHPQPVGPLAEFAESVVFSCIWKATGFLPVIILKIL